MRINFFLLILSLLVCGLIFFGLYQTYDNLFFSLGSGIVAFIPLVTAAAVRFPNAPRAGITVKALSTLFFAALLIANIIFTAKEVSSTAYIVVNGSMLCLWAALVYALVRTKQ